ncbi:MAG: DUF2293 domain-containing protein [bacterium]
MPEKDANKGDVGKDQLVVFSIVRPSRCSECGRDLLPGEFLKKEGDNALCMECADLGHLFYLPRGNAALTRRAGKHSGLQVVVVKWSRARKRYERQGVLVEEEALDRAEHECLADEDARKSRREREAARREKADQEFVKEFAGRVRALYPGAPSGEESRIAEHACRKYSGRVGRSAGAKELQEEPIRLAVEAYARHRFTDYDKLLAAGYERVEARRMIRRDLDELLCRWAEQGNGKT